MVNTLALLSTPTIQMDSSVKLPEDSLILVTHYETVYISGSLLVRDVLFVPTFSYNLLSVSKHIKDSNICVSLLQNHCIIQDPSNCMTIGVGEQKEGLYQLNQLLADSLFIKPSVSVMSSFGKTD